MSMGDELAGASLNVGEKAAFCADEPDRNQNKKHSHLLNYDNKARFHAYEFII